MDFFELNKKRQSCRAYKDIPVEREKLLKCAKAAMMGPSACNSQPWNFLVIDDIDTAKKISAALQDKVLPINKFTRNCNAYIIITEEPANLSAKLGGRFKDQEFAQMDIGIASVIISLAATYQGLGSCIIGWFDSKKISEILGIPGSKRIRLVIAVGYPLSDEIKGKVRKSENEVIHINKW